MIESRNKAARNKFQIRGIGLIVSISIVFLLSVSLEPGSFLAQLLLDHRESAGIYPFTIQNILWLFFGVGIADSIYLLQYAGNEQAVLKQNILPEDARIVLTSKDLERYKGKTDVIQSEGLPRLMIQCIRNYAINLSVPQLYQHIEMFVGFELHRSDLRFSVSKYVLWVVPSIGFLGTVIGLAQALGNLDGETSEVMATVVPQLAMAFNTTIVALSMSAILMLFSSRARLLDEAAISDTARYVTDNFVARLLTEDDEDSSQKTKSRINKTRTRLQLITRSDDEASSETQVEIFPDPNNPYPPT